MSVPKLSIGLPVYNGEEFIEDAINSILAQTYTNFELIISDNGSVDRTQFICQRFQELDSRVKYYRYDKNFGASWNFNNVFEKSSGVYFKWAAHDDLLAPEFLANTIEVLEGDKSIVLCHTDIKIIDHRGLVIEDHQHGSDTTNDVLSEINSHEAYLRFSNYISYYHPCIDVFGLIRRDALAMTPLIASYKGSDRNLLAELSLQGRFYRVPQYLFFSRMHENRSIKIKDDVTVTQWFDPKLKKRFVLPAWKNMYEYAWSVQRSCICLRQKLMCFVSLLRWVVTYRRRLFVDIKLTIKSVAPPVILSFYRFVKDKIC